MASLYKKVISGKPYWYLREMGWVDGKPKMVSERYLGTVADIDALLDARKQAMLPERTRHLDFGAVAAAWGLLADLGAACTIVATVGTGWRTWSGRTSPTTRNKGTIAVKTDDNEGASAAMTADLVPVPSQVLPRLSDGG